MIYYQLAILLVLLVPLAIAVRNYFVFQQIRSREQPRLMPQVSVLVPARNEERCIADCISSLLHQTYPNIELIVLDDASEDGTGAILQRLQQKRPDLQIVQGLPLPDGWTGKNWACYQLGLMGTGDLLVFTDADTVHSPESIAALVAYSEKTGAQFFSGVPYQQLKTFWERVIIPMTQFLYFAYLPNEWIAGRANPKFSAANGQLLCITRSAYDRIGGHESVKDSIVEDVALGKLAKEYRLRTALATATETVQCRMYTSFPEIMEGFSKNFFPGLGYNTLLLLGFILSSFALYVAPIGFLGAGIITGEYSLAWFWLPLFHAGLGMTIRALTAARFRMDRTQAFLHPLSVLMAIVIGINSARLAWFGKGHQWKGRSYGSLRNRVD